MWNGQNDLAALVDKEVRFRFYLTKGSLYSFWVAPTSAGASNGFVLGGGPGLTAHADTLDEVDLEYAKRLVEDRIQALPALDREETQ